MSYRGLGVVFGCNYHTIMRSMHLLLEHGYVTRKDEPLGAAFTYSTVADPTE